MSQTKIAALPEDVMIEIFSFLDTKSLKKAARTCKNWKGIVERETLWSLTSRGWYGKRQLEMLSTSNRKFSKVSMKSLNQLDNKMVDAFAKHGANIRRLDLSNTILSNRAMWCQVLTKLPTLMTLTLDKVGLPLRKSEMGEHGWRAVNTFAGLNSDDWPTLHKLTSLEISRTDYQVLKFFEKSQLKSFKLNITSGVKEHLKPLLNFLSTQRGLEKLVIQKVGSTDSKLFRTPIPVEFFPFRLKQLSLVDINLRDTPNEDYNILMDFMKLHVATLEVLKLQGKFPPSILEFAITKFTKLKTLRLTKCGTSRDLILKANNSVTSLHLSNVNDGLGRSLHQLINSLPNVEKLTYLNGPSSKTTPMAQVQLLKQVDVAFLKHVAETLKKLKNLSVSSIDGVATAGLKFHDLESLHIGRLGGRINWDFFALTNPSITKLSIKKVGKEENLDFKAAKENLSKLRQLTIEDSNLKCDSQFFNIVRMRCKELELLELNYKSLKLDISSVADIRGLRFRHY